MIAKLEAFLFARRLLVLGALAVLTFALGAAATQLRLETGFARALPAAHPYIQTFTAYQDRLIGANRAVAILETDGEDIYTPAFLAKLKRLTDDMATLSRGRDQGVTSLWTPNTRIYEITEEGFAGRDLISANVTPDAITPEQIDALRGDVERGGFVGQLVGRDLKSAMVMSELLDVDPRTGAAADPFALGERMEALRAAYGTDGTTLRLLGFPTMVTEIKTVATAWTPVFFGVSLLLVILSLYAYVRVATLAAVTVACSLASVVWQLGIVTLLGYGLDPLSIILPFLVFAIGVSHGVQQLNVIIHETVRGASAERAARTSFSTLLPPGLAALASDAIGFGALLLIPIPLMQDAAAVAIIGIALKALSNLVMLPLLASYLPLSRRLHQRPRTERPLYHAIGRVIAATVRPRQAAITVAVAFVLAALALVTAERHVGDRQNGSPELHANAVYNRDTAYATSHYDPRFNLFTVVIETAPQGCITPATMRLIDELGWAVRAAPGVSDVISVATLSKRLYAGFNEGNLKHRAIAANKDSLSQSIFPIPVSAGILDGECTLLPLYVFLTDTRAETLEGVIAAVDGWTARTTLPEGFSVRLASGNGGVFAAVNDTIEAAETPLLLLVMALVSAVVLLTFRDWRAAVCCLVPLGLATILGWWFMGAMGLGLKISTLPVLALAVGIGVDYAFYIYNRLQHAIAHHHDAAHGFQRALSETGTAVAFTAITLAASVVSWAFSPLKFQADMGLLMTFMFLANMVLCVTVLPAFAVTLDRLVPRGARLAAPAPATA